MTKIIEELYNKYKNIEYGWKDKKGNIHSHINEGYVKNFSLQTPEELSKSNTGNCWETVELLREELNKLNIPNKTYFFVIPTGKFYSHSIIVAEINNKFYWIELSHKDFKGIKEFNSTIKLMNYILDNFILITNKEPYNPKYIKIYDYEKPKEHIGCVHYYFYCFAQKNITKNYLPEHLKSIEHKNQ